ncbi:MAG: dihydrofolate synthase / folylpolyglutamate synthase, partial [Micromonosporaceae bacterium]|nr:dihydrofolate synthase / folylpolyglutamate synthase [Micromonosporaceae bacterium]
MSDNLGAADQRNNSGAADQRNNSGGADQRSTSGRADQRNNSYAAVEAELNARGSSRMVFDISRIEALLDLLGSPQRAYPAIHLTGTNGKT